jgi:hypothetical protein
MDDHGGGPVRRLAAATLATLSLVALVVVVRLAPEGVTWLADSPAGLRPVLAGALAAVALWSLALLSPAPRPFELVAEVAAAGMVVVAVLALLQAFPFDFSNSWADWSGVVRVLLSVGLFMAGLWLVLRTLDAVRFASARQRRRSAEPVAATRGVPQTHGFEVRVESGTNPGRRRRAPVAQVSSLDA